MVPRYGLSLSGLVTLFKKWVSSAWVASVVLHAVVLGLFILPRPIEKPQTFSIGVRQIPVSLGEKRREEEKTKRERVRARLTSDVRSVGALRIPKQGREGKGEAGVRGEEGDSWAEIHPVYPRISRKLGEEGRVVVRVSLDPRGQLLNAQVLQSSGFMRLDDSAINAVRKGVFRLSTPWKEAVEKNLSIVFKLEES